jgi:hypothetical protein
MTARNIRNASNSRNESNNRTPRHSRDARKSKKAGKSSEAMNSMQGGQLYSMDTINIKDYSSRDKKNIRDVNCSRTVRISRKSAT